MNVREAIEILQEADPEAMVILSSDEEGNGYRVAHISIDEVGCDFGTEIQAVNQEDIDAGEYEDWEENIFSAVVIW
jgi:hypothetical protein